MRNIAQQIADRLMGRPSPSEESATQPTTETSVTFHGMFQAQKLTNEEQHQLQEMLERYKNKTHKNLQQDVQQLSSITGEVRAIQHQAALLHGERIKKVQTLLKSYKDGVFSAWLVYAYGNRQTPYNLLLYYNFIQSIPQEMKEVVLQIPRQAIYSLASRQASMPQKLAFLKEHKDKTKKQILENLRDTFPLEATDKRRHTAVPLLLATKLHQAQEQVDKLNKQEKAELRTLLEEILASL